jgi:hypothetical protein
MGTDSDGDAGDEPDRTRADADERNPSARHAQPPRRPQGTIASSEVARSIPMTRFKITDGTLLFMDRACSNARFHHARVHNSEPQRAHRATSEQTRRADSITV